MAVANLVDAGTSVDTGLDSLVILRNLDAKRGGATLNTVGYTPTVIKAGHLVIKETATGEYKVMPVSGSAYAAIPVGHTYEGVVIASVLTSKPMVGILTNGTVNEAVSPYPVTAEAKTALKQITFTQD